jgi:hypothetical protein
MTFDSLFRPFRHEKSDEGTARLFDAAASLTAGIIVRDITPPISFAPRGQAVTDKRIRFHYPTQTGPWRPELSDEEREELSRRIGL